MAFLRLMLLSAVSAAFMCTAAASAQADVSVYAAPTYNAFGFSSGSSVSLKSGTGGVTAGMLYNFPIQSRLTAGIDVRTIYSPGAKGGDFTGAALRIAFVPHKVRLRPYFQLGGGVATTTVTAYTASLFPTTGTVLLPSTQRYTNGVLELAFGLDIRLTEHFDLRAFDYGAAAGASGSKNAAAAGFLDAGVVYHLRPRQP